MARQKKTDSPQSATVLLAYDPGVENIFVQKVKGNHYRVLTIPFWAYNISLGDIVECHPDEDGIGLFVEKVLQKSGNRTVRIACLGEGRFDHPEGVKLIQYFQERQLRFEILKPSLISVNVPTEFDYRDLTMHLEAVAKDAKIEWEDGDPQPDVCIDGSDVKKPKNR